MNYQAFILNHPQESFDSLEGKFITDKKVSPDALFFYRNKPTVLLVYSESQDSTLQSVKGIMQYDVKGMRRKPRKYSTGKNWYALTMTAVENIESKYFTNKKQLIDSIQEGDFWDDPMEMGPYTLGSNLELNEVQRQMFRHKLGKAAEQLDKSIKWLIPSMIMALLLIILTRN